MVEQIGLSAIDEAIDEYLKSVKAYGIWAVKKGHLSSIEEANALLEYATQQAESGAWGPNLPLFSTIYKKRHWDVAEPSWILGEKSSSGKLLSLPEGVRQYAGSDMTSSEILSWAKFNQEEDGVSPELQWQMDKWYMEQQQDQQAAMQASAVAQNQDAYQFAIDEQRLAQQQEQFDAQLALKRQELAWQMQGQDPETIWEEARSQIVANYTGGRNWINKWYAQHTPNPYTFKREMDQYYARKADYQQKASERKVGTKMMGGEVTGSRVETGTRAWRTPLSASEARDKLKNLKGPDRWAKGPQLTTPGWLAPFSQQLVQGRGIKQGQISTPSIQQWTGMSPTTREKLAGYVDWADKKPFQDVMWEMQTMNPSAQRSGRGRWATARQV